MIYENLMKIEIRIEGYCVNLGVKMFALGGGTFISLFLLFKSLIKHNKFHVCLYKERFFGEDIVK